MRNDIEVLQFTSHVHKRIFIALTQIEISFLHPTQPPFIRFTNRYNESIQVV